MPVSPFRQVLDAAAGGPGERLMRPRGNGSTAVSDVLDAVFPPRCRRGVGWQDGGGIMDVDPLACDPQYTGL